MFQMQYEEDTNSIEKLKEQNQYLNQQLKRLTLAEKALVSSQEQLNEQLRIYRRLNELARQFHMTFELDALLDMVTQFVLYDLNFERCLTFVFDAESDIFRVHTMDGYYDDQLAQAIAAVVLPPSDAALSSLLLDTECLLCMEVCHQADLQALRKQFGMDEYVVFALHGETADPYGLLVAGNSKAMMPYQTRVVEDGMGVLGVSNVASQASIAIMNASFYRALQQERQSLEAKVKSRTDELVSAQEALVRELSTPLIPLSQHVVLLPVIGRVDSHRAQQIMEVLLQGVAQYQARIVILDITGIISMDREVAENLMQSARAVKLLGAQVILTGIGPVLAQTLVQLGADFSGLITLSTLQSGIAYAFSRV